MPEYTAGVRDAQAVLPDGRTVAWTEVGPADGAPVVRLPGTPGSRWSIRADKAPWLTRPLNVITIERPGFGVSTPLPGRRFAEVAADTAAVLDLVGVDRAYVRGGSGGAPHVLAFAALYPHRVIAASVVAGAAPLTDNELDEVIPINAESSRLTRAGDFVGLRELLTAQRAEILRDPLASLREVMATASAQDLEVMRDNAWQSAYVRGVTEALAAGVDGWFDESIALNLPWTDFSMDAITASVTWWHSDSDRNRPLSAAKRLVAQLPNASFNTWSGGGHLTSYYKEANLLDELLARA